MRNYDKDWRRFSPEQRKLVGTAPTERDAIRSEDELLINFDSGIVDASLNSINITAHNGAARTTSTSKHGSGSLDLTSANSWIELNSTQSANKIVVDLSENESTFECWVKPGSGTNYRPMIEYSYNPTARGVNQQYCFDKNPADDYDSSAKAGIINHTRVATGVGSRYGYIVNDSVSVNNTNPESLHTYGFSPYEQLLHKGWSIETEYKMPRSGKWLIPFMLTHWTSISVGDGSYVYISQKDLYWNYNGTNYEITWNFDLMRWVQSTGSSVITPGIMSGTKTFSLSEVDYSQYPNDPGHYVNLAIIYSFPNVAFYINGTKVSEYKIIEVAASDMAERDTYSAGLNLYTLRGVYHPGGSTGYWASYSTSPPSVDDRMIVMGTRSTNSVVPLVNGATFPSSYPIGTGEVGTWPTDTIKITSYGLWNDNTSSYEQLIGVKNEIDPSSTTEKVARFLAFPDESPTVYEFYASTFTYSQFEFKIPNFRNVFNQDSTAGVYPGGYSTIDRLRISSAPIAAHLDDDGNFDYIARTYWPIFYSTDNVTWKYFVPANWEALDDYTNSTTAIKFIHSGSGKKNTSQAQDTFIQDARIASKVYTTGIKPLQIHRKLKPNEWNHIAFCYKDSGYLGRMNCILNGIQSPVALDFYAETQGFLPSMEYWYNLTKGISEPLTAIGGRLNFGGSAVVNKFTGYIDEVRFTNGHNRYFTMPTNPISTVYASSAPYSGYTVDPNGFLTTKQNFSPVALPAENPS